MAAPPEMEKHLTSDASLTPPGIKGVTWRHLASISLSPENKSKQCVVRESNAE
jgi:hypothetical protein